MWNRLIEKKRLLYWTWLLRHSVNEHCRAADLSPPPNRGAQDIIYLASSLDDNYALPFAAMAVSVSRALPPSTGIKFYLLTKGVSEETQRRLGDSLRNHPVELVWVRLKDEVLANARISNHASQAAYYRILLADILPQNLDKVIYLDPDMLVLDDIRKLWDQDVSEHYLLAVPEQGVDCMYVSSPLGLINYKELGFPEDQRIFNTGVLVVNLTRWRTDGVGSQCLSYLENHRNEIRWWDQDCLNAVIAKQWSALPCRWNVLSQLFINPSWRDGPIQDFAEFMRTVKNPGIIHFNTTAKPWHKRNLHPYTKLFYRYLDRTDWKGYRP